MTIKQLTDLELSNQISRYNHMLQSMTTSLPGGGEKIKTRLKKLEAEQERRSGVVSDSEASGDDLQRSKVNATQIYQNPGRIEFLEMLKADTKEIEEDIKNMRFGDYKNVLLGEYSVDLGNFIGSGGFGSVFKSTTQVYNNLIALKVIPLASGPVEESIQREADIMFDLQPHENIVTYYNSFAVEKLPHVLKCKFDQMLPMDIKQVFCIAMELYPWTLDKVIINGLDNKIAWKIFGDVVRGLNHIHEKGYIHRDISKDNIFLDSSWTAFL